MRKTYYLPHPEKPVAHTLGEGCFFERKKFWRLVPIVGYSWKDMCVTNRGFSFLNCSPANPTPKNQFDDLLAQIGVDYKNAVSFGGWSYLYNISTRKTNLEKIRAAYEKYFLETAQAIVESGDYYIRGNEIISSEIRDHYLSFGSLPIDYWTKITDIKQITENYANN